MMTNELLKPFHLMQHDHEKSSLFFMADAFYNAPNHGASNRKDRD